MTNYLNDAVYVAYTDVQQTTNITGLQTESEANIDRLITEAQLIIDGYIISYKVPYDDDQVRIFPTKDEDGNQEDIPNDIKLATIYIVENLYLAGAPSTTTIGIGDIKQEKTGDRSVTFGDTKEGIQTYIPEKALNILDRYKVGFINQTI